MPAMRFDWDDAKAASNPRKHGVAFEDAARVFLDDARIEGYDGREDYGEDRWISIGQVAGMLLCVVYTVRLGEIIRIISARKATPHERRQYRETYA